MADDKTAAKAEAADFARVVDGVVHGPSYRAFVAGAAWQAEQSVRRVAPDRETLAQALYALHPYSPSYPHDIGRPLRWNELAQGRIDKSLADADALLASGVLGAPAEDA